MPILSKEEIDKRIIEDAAKDVALCMCLDCAWGAEYSYVSEKISRLEKLIEPHIKKNLNFDSDAFDTRMRSWDKKEYSIFNFATNEKVLNYNHLVMLFCSQLIRANNELRKDKQFKRYSDNWIFSKAILDTTEQWIKTYLDL